MPPGIVPVAVALAIVAVCWAVRATDRRRMFTAVNEALGRPGGRLR